MSVTFGPPLGAGWEPMPPRWQRFVECPNDCGYMAREVYGSGEATGVCLKCRHTWRVASPELPAPKITIKLPEADR